MSVHVAQENRGRGRQQKEHGEELRRVEDLHASVQPNFPLSLRVRRFNIDQARADSDERYYYERSDRQTSTLDDLFCRATVGLLSFRELPAHVKPEGELDHHPTLLNADQGLDHRRKEQCDQYCFELGLEVPQREVESRSNQHHRQDVEHEQRLNLVLFLFDKEEPNGV